MSTQTIVQPGLDHVSLVEATWGLARIAVLRVRRCGIDLLAGRDAIVWSSVGAGGGCSSGDRPGHLVDDVRRVLRTAARTYGPIVLAGDPELVSMLRRVDRVMGHVDAVLRSDHRASTTAEALSAATQVMRRSLDAEQQAAMTSVALACDLGTVRRGLDSLLSTTSSTDHLVVAEGAIADEVRRHVDHHLVAVPRGFLPDDELVVVPHLIRPAASIISQPRDGVGCGSGLAGPAGVAVSGPRG